MRLYVAVCVIAALATAAGAGDPASTSSMPSMSSTSAPAASAAESRAENLALRRQVEGLQAQVKELEKLKKKDPTMWLVLGFVGQFVFGSRFVVQWIATERQRKSVVPTAFWYLSLCGTIVLLTYSIHRVDWVFIAGFSLNLVIYLRNLYFIHHKPAPAP